MHKHEFLDQIPLFAIGALSEKEADEVQQHLDAGCEICEPEVRQFSEVVARLPEALTDYELPPEIKEQIDRRIDELPTPAIGHWWWKVASIAAVLVLASWIGFRWQNQQEQLRSQTREIAELRGLLERHRKQIEWLRTPAVQMALLMGTESAQQARAKILYNPEAGRGLLYVDYLSPLSADQSYQLWVIGNAGPVSGGIFQPDSMGHAILIIPPIADAPKGLQFAVTIEPFGGVPQPTGSMVLAGAPL